MACRINPYLDKTSNPTQTSNKFVSGSTRDNQGCCEHDMSQYVSLAEHIGLKIELKTLKYQMDYPDISFVNDRANIDQKDTTEKQTLEENDQIILLQTKKMNLEMEIQSLTNTIGILSNNSTNTDLERDLELSREREKLLNRTVASKDQQIRELTTRIQTGPDDTASKEEMIIVLLQEKMGLRDAIGQLQNHLKHLEGLYDKLTYKFNDGENYIEQLFGTISSLKYKLHSLETNSDNRLLESKAQLAGSQQRVRELENMLATEPTDNADMVRDLIHENESLQQKYDRKTKDARKFEAEAREANLLLAQLRNRMPYEMDYSYLSSKSQYPERGVYPPP